MCWTSDSFRGLKNTSGRIIQCNIPTHTSPTMAIYSFFFNIHILCIFSCQPLVIHTVKMAGSVKHQTSASAQRGTTATPTALNVSEDHIRFRRYKLEEKYNK